METFWGVGYYCERMYERPNFLVPVHHLQSTSGVFRIFEPGRAGALWVILFQVTTRLKFSHDVGKAFFAEPSYGSQSGWRVGLRIHFMSNHYPVFM